MKKIVLSLLFLLILVAVFAQVPPNYRFVKTWHVSDRFGTVDSIPVDTVHLNYQISNPIDRFSIANSFNGNLGSPIQSKLYFDRPANTDFIFSNAYYPYLTNLNSTIFYNTKTPFSYIDYNTGGTTYRAEDHVKFLFTGNVNKKLNFGTTLDYIYATGEYNNQAVQRFAGSLFGSYQGKHYSATGVISTNNLSNYENGGTVDSIAINPLGLATKDIPTRLTGYSNFKQTQFFFTQQYSVGFEREVKVKEDSVRMEYVPVTRFAHTLKLDDVRKRYFEPTTDSTFYKNTYYPIKQTNDSSALQTMTNTFSISLVEEFNKWMPFGLTAFVENEIQRYTFNKDNLIKGMDQSTTRLGGILSKQRGQRFKYNVLGDLSLIGYKAGNFRLEGNAGGFFKLWNDSITLVANGFVRNDSPSYFLEHYDSNHFRWDRNFANIYRTHVGGTFSIPTRLFSVNVSVENISKYIYFDSDALPAQFSGNIQVLAANLKQDFHVGKFGLENNVVYQVSSQQNVLPLPDLTLYHNLYYDDIWFKVLSMQLGVNVRYHTAYYAPAYMPATGQFYTQSKTLIGNYPVATVYLNFHLKRTRFFVEYYHVNQLFMKGAYYSMPNYPIDPAEMKMGVSWNFYD
ncbi:MAG: putative porin [Bacteroidota bacterium]|nr:putative porin [Bacteroidota bacterium]